jgi:type IV pilus assembly protein PilC
MADYIERIVIVEKKIKNAMTYPLVVAFVAILVVGILVTFVLPTFAGLFGAFGGEMPLATRALIAMTDWLSRFGVYLLGVFIVAAIFGFSYVRTPAGKYQWDKLSLRLPIIGRILLLNELSRCCRTISLLFKVGLPLPEILSMATQGTNNKIMAEALNGVQQDLIRGEGLSKPMSRRSVFLPLMVQMVGVGEETGNLDNTMATVAESFEVDADDRTNAAVGLIQPVITILIGLVVAWIAIAMVSAMYGIYGQLPV